MVKITKSLSVGLTAACFSTMLLMSSCSKEDALTPIPQSDINQSSKLREAAGGILAVEYVTSTDGPTGFNSPNKWNFPEDDIILGPSENATSSLTAYAGNPLTKWFKPLPVTTNGAGNIIKVANNSSKMERAETTINNLIVGKKYKFTYSVSTTAIGYSNLANEAVLKFYSSGDYIADTTNFAYKESQWITKSIEFVAKNKSYNLEFRGIDQFGYSYTNIHVGKNAIKVIN